MEFNVTDPKNTLPPNTSKPSVTSQEPSSEGNEPSADKKDPSAELKKPSALNSEPSAEQKESSGPNDEPEVQNKAPSPEDKQASAAKQPSTEPASNSKNAQATPSNKSTTPSASRKTPPPQQKPTQSRFALFLSVLVLILLAAISLYFWQKQVQQSIQIEQLLQQSRSDLQDIESTQRSVQQRLGKIDDRLFKQQGDIAQLSRQSEFNAQKLTDLGARSRMDWLLAEAEYLMRLANQRLNLEHDIQSAEAMLSSADSILAEINDPGLTEIRKTLASEIVSLQKVRHLDHQGLYLKLDALVQNTDELKQQAFLADDSVTLSSSTSNPDQSSKPSDVSTENTFLAVWRSIWKDLKQAVTIRRLDQPLPPLLAPEQHYYLKQNLRLMLDQASLALLDENTAVYQVSLKKADTWLKQYFMQNDPLVQQIQATLDEMVRYEISPKLPDISHSLRLTKAKIESFYRQHALSKLSSPDSEAKAEIKQDTETQETPASQGAAL